MVAIEVLWSLVVARSPRASPVNDTRFSNFRNITKAQLHELPPERYSIFHHLTTDQLQPLNSIFQHFQETSIPESELPFLYASQPCEKWTSDSSTRRTFPTCRQPTSPTYRRTTSASTTSTTPCRGRSSRTSPWTCLDPSDHRTTRRASWVTCWPRWRRSRRTGCSTGTSRA